MNNSKPWGIGWLLLAILTLLMVLSSCGISRKSQTVAITTKDSSSVKKQDSVQVQAGSITAVSKDSSQYEREITIEVDTAYQGSDYGPTEQDYGFTNDTATVPRPFTWKPITIKLPGKDPGPVTIDLGPWKPAKIIIKEKGQQGRYDSVQARYYDSTALQQQDSTGVQVTDLQSSSSSFKWRPSIPAIFTIVAILAFLWYMLPPRKRKN